MSWEQSVNYASEGTRPHCTKSDANRNRAQQRMPWLLKEAKERDSSTEQTKTIPGERKKTTRPNSPVVSPSANKRLRLEKP